MTIWPRTLLWRSVLLIALLLIVGNIAWLEILRSTEREPRAHQAAQQIVSIVNLTRAALISAQPSKRIGRSIMDATVVTDGDGAESRRNVRLYAVCVSTSAPTCVDVKGGDKWRTMS